MKIISGHYKGRNFYPAKGSSARPTSNVIREALFNMVYDDIIGAEVIDLFAGSGGIGLEALSRDAAMVHFVDADRKNIRTIEGYLDEYKVDKDKYHTHGMDFRRAVHKMKALGANAQILYIDPPYNDGLYTDALKACIPVLDNDALVFLEHGKRVTFDMLPQYELVEQRKYGSKILTILRFKGE